MIQIQLRKMDYDQAIKVLFHTLPMPFPGLFGAIHSKKFFDALFIKPGEFTKLFYG